MKYLTVSQVEQICSQHKYIIFRRFDGSSVGINGGIAKIARRKSKRKAGDETCYLSYHPCSLAEYITKKLPFQK